MTTTRRLMIFVAAIVLLAIGGGLTSLIAAEGASNIMPGLATVTERPEASVSEFAGNQGLWFFILLGAVVFNVAGAGLTGAAIFFFLNRGIEQAKAEEPANHETIGEALPKLRRNSTSTNEQPAGGELPAETAS
ncbi:MAG: hypothetical protein AAF787_05260 [Chloroflexota bacterium]